MRIVDLLHPHLDGITAVVNAYAGDIELGSYLHLPSGVTREALAGDDEGRWSASTLVVGLVGPDAALHTSVEGFLRLLPRFTLGTRGLLLSGFRTEELPVHLLVSGLVAGSCQIRQVASLGYAHIHSGIAFECVGSLQPLLDYFGNGPGVALDGLAAQLRVVNEYRLTDFVSRSVRASAAAAPLPAAQPAADPAGSPLRLESARRIEDLQSANRGLEARVREFESQLRRARERVTALETSATYRLGKTLAEAARRPGKDTLKLPVRVWRLYQNRAVPQATTPPPAPLEIEPAAAPGGRLDPESRLLLAWSTAQIVPKTTLSVAGVWTEETLQALSVDCVANTLGPNDALLILERTQPDLVLIEAAAGRAGHPWAAMGTPIGAERDRRLADILDHAHGIGVPVVFWWNIPPGEAPGLAHLARRCDAVVADGATTPLSAGRPRFTRGLQPAVYNPVDLDPARPARPLYVGGLDAPGSLVHRALAAAAPLGLRVVREPDGRIDEAAPPPEVGTPVEPAAPSGLARLYRSSSVCLAAPFAARAGAGVGVRALEQLACGAWVISGPNEGLARSVGDHVRFVEGADDVPAILEEVAARGPRSRIDARAAIRAVFDDHTTRAQLAGVARLLQLGTDPLAARDVSVLVRLDAGTALDTFVSSVLAQAHRPREVVVGLPTGAAGAAERGLAELEGAGLPVIGVEEGGGPGALARAATSPWVSVWSPGRPYGPPFLQDLLIGAESSRARVVGYTEKVDQEFTGEVSAQAAIVDRTVAVDRDLIADAAAGGRDLAAWARAGVPLYGLAEVDR
jgi:hypothetical protein